MADPRLRARTQPGCQTRLDAEGRRAAAARARPAPAGDPARGRGPAGRARRRRRPITAVRLTTRFRWAHGNPAGPIRPRPELPLRFAGDQRLYVPARRRWRHPRARGALASDTGPLRQLDRSFRARWPDRPASQASSRRRAAAGLPASTCCHTFRATGITAYLSNGGTLEHAQRIAGHASPKTTKLYDRTVGHGDCRRDRAYRDLNAVDRRRMKALASRALATAHVVNWPGIPPSIGEATKNAGTAAHQRIRVRGRDARPRYRLAFLREGRNLR